MPKESKEPELTRIGDYKFIKTLGSGTFAKVKLAIHDVSMEKVAVKCIFKANLPDEYSIRNMHREGKVMKQLLHPNIVQLYEIIETKDDIYLAMEYARGGEVLDYIVAHGKLKEAEAKRFMAQIADAVASFL